MAPALPLNPTTPLTAALQALSIPLQKELAAMIILPYTIEWDTLYFCSTFQVFFAFEDKTGFPLADCLIAVSRPNSTIKLD